MFAKYRSHILLHLIIFMWGFTGILGVLISIDAEPIVWYRLVIASVSLGIFMLFMKRSFAVSSKKRLFSILLVGIIVGLHWLTFYQSIKLSTASLGIICLSTTTIHVTWLEPIILKKKFNVFEFLLGVCVVPGIYLVADDFSGNDYLALAIGLTSALFAALFAVFNAKFVEDDKPSVITFYEMISAMVVLTALLIFQGRMNASLFQISLSDFLWLLFLGIFCTSLAFLVVVQIVKTLGSFTVSLSINLEPVYTILLAIFILHENDSLGSSFYLGAGIILSVVLVNAILKAPQVKKKIQQMRGLNQI